MQGCLRKIIPEDVFEFRRVLVAIRQGATRRSTVRAETITELIPERADPVLFSSRARLGIGLCQTRARARASG